MCKGTTRKFLNKKILCSIAIPKPPIDEQRRIVAKIDSLFLTITNIERAFEKTKSQTNLIDKTILAKAFRGELVPQDPNDEPASVLLQRIKNVA